VDLDIAALRTSRHSATGTRDRGSERGVDVFAQPPRPIARECAMQCSDAVGVQTPRGPLPLQQLRGMWMPRNPLARLPRLLRTSLSRSCEELGQKSVVRRGAVRVARVSSVFKRGRRCHASLDPLVLPPERCGGEADVTVRCERHGYGIARVRDAWPSQRRNTPTEIDRASSWHSAMCHHRAGTYRKSPASSVAMWRTDDSPANRANIAGRAASFDATVLARK
jgi:hypothetical protein